MDPGTGEHPHQGIDAKKIDSAANEIADPWLRDAEQFGSFSLGELPLPDELTHLAHEGGTKPKVLSLSFAKAKIGENIPTRWSDLGIQGATSGAAGQLFAVAAQRPDTAPALAQGPAGWSVASSSERRVRRKLLLRTSPRRRPDAP